MTKVRRQSAVTEDLIALADQLTEIAIEECNPANWPGEGKKLVDMDKAEKGDRYWSKQNATGTILLIKQLHNLISQRNTGQAKRLGITSTTAQTPDDNDRAVEMAEAEAAAAMQKMLTKAQNKVHH